MALATADGWVDVGAVDDVAWTRTRYGSAAVVAVPQPAAAGADEGKAAEGKAAIKIEYDDGGGGGGGGRQQEGA